MSLNDLTADVEETYESLDEEISLELDDDTRQELTMLMAAMDKDEDDIVEQAVRLLFQSTVETGKLDFHLRSVYDVTYDEYLSGMTYEEMGGGIEYPQQQQNDERRYQF